MFRRVLALPLILLACFVLLAGAGASAAPLPVPQPLAQRLTGTLNIISGDRPDLKAEPLEHVSLVTSDGREVTLVVSADLRGSIDLYRLTGQQVIVTVSPNTGLMGPAMDNPNAGEVLAVTAIEPAPGTRAAEIAPVTGNTKWVSIGCKFADIVDEPEPLAYFQNMYAGTYPGLDAYWREASYDNINLVGSTAVGWYTLPKPMSAYQIDNTHIQWTDLLQDCAAQADSQVNFDEYMGINLMLNGEPGCCAWGGNRTVTLDGVERTWSVTWLPPWAYEDITVIAHEMTHAYGILWHPYAGENAYGDPWDVVSAVWYGCDGSLDHPEYGCLGQHTIGYHRDYLGWVPASRKVSLGTGRHTVFLERTTQPNDTGYLLAIVPIHGSSNHYYTIEARQLVGYDRKLPGESIVIHEIGGLRHDVQLVDSWEDIAMWNTTIRQPGHTWISPEGGIIVHVDSATESGFEVTITNGLLTHSTTLSPSDDTYVLDLQPDTNFGESPELRLYNDSLLSDLPGAYASTVLKFDQTQVPSLAARYRLRLYVTDDYGIWGKKPWAYSAYPYFGDGNVPWTEHDLTWNNANFTTTGGFREPVVVPTRDGNWMEWDVTSAITAWGLQALEVGHNMIVFSSKEGDNPPQLIVDYLTDAAPTITDILIPTDDAFVQQAYPTKTYGTQAAIKVRDGAKDYRAYVKFDLAALGAVQQATLRLHPSADAPTGGTVYAVAPFYTGTSTPWQETGLNWNKAPAFTGTPLNTVGSIVAAQWVDLDVTAAAIAAQAAGQPLSLGLGGGSAIAAVYSSKEGDHAPQLVVVTAGGPPPTTTLTFTPTNDAYVMQSQPKTVYGTRKALNVRNAAKDANAYVKFNLIGVIDTVETATLRLYGMDAGPDGGDVYAVSPYYAGTTQLWLDNGLSWKNAPPISGASLASLGQVGAKQWVEVDVTDAAREALLNNSGRLSLALRSNSSNLVTYSSKEGAHPPELIVELSAP